MIDIGTMRDIFSRLGYTVVDNNAATKPDSDAFIVVVPDDKVGEVIAKVIQEALIAANENGHFNLDTVDEVVSAVSYMNVCQGSSGQFLLYST